MVCDAGHETPNASPDSAIPSAATGTVAANAITTSPAITKSSAATSTRRAPRRSMIAPPGPTASSPVSGWMPSSSPVVLRLKLRTSCR